MGQLVDTGQSIKTLELNLKFNPNLNNDFYENLSLVVMKVLSFF